MILPLLKQQLVYMDNPYIDKIVVGVDNVKQLEKYFLLA